MITRASRRSYGSAQDQAIAQIHSQTRYAVRHTDGRWLVIGHSGREIRPLWTPDKAQAWTWPSMSEAVMAAMSVEGEIRECLCWTVEPV